MLCKALFVFHIKYFSSYGSLSGYLWTFVAINYQIGPIWVNPHFAYPKI